MISKYTLLGLFLCSAAIAQQTQTSATSLQARQVYSRVLSDPKRDLWQMPDKVVATLNFSSTEVVGLIGDDDGYFARWIAPHVKQADIISSDANASKRVQFEPDPTITITYVANPNALPSTNTRYDTLFLCNVLGRLSSQPLFFLKLLLAVKPGGRIVIIDFFKTSAPKGINAIPGPVVLTELAAVGLPSSAIYTFLPLQFFVVLQ